MRPFHNLKVDELRRELRARGVHFEKGTLKDDLQLKLDDILRGVTQVSALLLTDPTQPLSSLCLDQYEVVASEPLHDLKGHIVNIITELPYILPPGDTATKCTHLMECCLSKEKKSCADLRRVAIQIYLLLKDLECSSKVVLLLQTVIKMGEICYSLDVHRSPRQVLQMYNICWLHMELCRDLFGNPHKLSRSKMFGIYVHALTAHSPTQYELASLRSLNTENQERLFGQSRTIAETCTNHHLENVIAQVMVRLQAKQEQHMAMLSVEKGDSQVSSVAKHLPKLPGTTVKSSFIRHREDSWQNHLQRISPFLTAGEGVWWDRTPTGFHFYDGDDDPSAQGCTFTLLHFRQHSVTDVEERRKLCWDKIVSERIPIPANSIKLYDTQGMTTGKLVYRDRSMVLHIPRTLPGHSASLSSELLDPDHTMEHTSPTAPRTLPGHSANLSGHSSELLGPEHIMEHTSPTATRTLPGHSANLSGHSSELLGPDHIMEHTSPTATRTLPGHSANLSGHSAELLGPDHTMEHTSPTATRTLPGHSANLSGHSAELLGPDHTMEHTSPTATRTLPGHSANLSGHSAELLGPDHTMEHTSPTATCTLPGHSASLSGHSSELLDPDHIMEHTSTCTLPGHSANLSGQLLCPDHTMEHIPAATPSLHGTDHTMHTPPSVLTPGHSVDFSRHSPPGTSAGTNQFSSHVPSADHNMDEDVIHSYINITLTDIGGGLKTSLGNCMKKILECDDELTSFDELRYYIKNSNVSVQSHLIKKYKAMAASLGRKVLRKQSEYDKQLREIERCHFLEHAKLPNKTTNTEYSRTLKDRNIATAILRNLNIHF